MVNVDALRIKNSNLDSNNWVVLRGLSWNAVYGKRNAVSPTDGHNSGSQWEIAKGDKVGIENPVFPITGAINTHDYSVIADLLNATPSTNTSKGEGEGVGSMQGIVTIAYLINLWRDVSGTTVLEINFGNPEGQSKWPAYDLGTSGMTVEIDSFDFKPRENSEGRHFIDITLLCKEVRP